MPALTTVVTHATGDVYPASDFNTYTRDNINYLIQAGATLLGASTLVTTNQFHIVSTTAVVDNINPGTQVVGQTVELLFQAASTIRNNGGGTGNIRTAAGADRAVDANEIVTLTYDGATWREQSSQLGMTPIYDNLLAGSATSVSTGTLPANFTHLLVVIYARTDSATGIGSAVQDNIGVRLNGDSGANYDYQDSTGHGFTAATAAKVAVAIGGAATANLYAANLLFIPDYRGAVRRKTFFCQTGGYNGNAGVDMTIGVGVGSWRTAATPITSLTFVVDPTPGTTNFVVDSRFTVYGLN